MHKYLILYSSIDGHTQSICKKISEHMDKDKVDIFPISQEFINLNEYKTIIIGASIRYGKYRKELYKFIIENKDSLDIKNNAFFSVNVVARKSNKNTPETNPYLIKFLTNIDWVPKKVAVFAGKIEYPKYNFFDKYAIKFIMWITKGPTNTSKTYEFTDWGKVKAFAESLKS
ncbi:MAG: menaquinone-dependent protoporphyrinogen IX dehydrogenase [Gammaproteobacteria bacterium]|nr:menaquinone-dependent protoporphyrinogen IX dehydrogenase [Gammaproteobacteria bacterium]|tara:strand:- start:9579 stop:10094 length:516 start_codon:yes stop_codon:yes gene_type:complete